MAQAQPHSPKRNSWIGLIAAVVMFVVVTGGLIYAMNALGTERLQQIVRDAGPLAPLIYILLRAATYVFAPLTTGPIQIASGALFGVWGGIILSVIGETLGGSINFWIGRRFGRPVALRLAGEEGLKKAEEYYHLVGDWRGLIVARLVLFAIWDFLSYVIGFTPAKFVHYLLVSLFVGAIPTAAAVFLGAQLGGDNQTLLVVGLIVLCVVLSLPVIFSGRIRRWMDSRHANTPES
ncbi:MAG: TVP38/TMEM64 family protein [Anaerolineae bacterium]|nr:TVP38/TMEM64 family protein [Anaerolineae bacterium]